MICQHKSYYNYLGFEAEINSVRSDLTHLQAWKSTVDTKLMNLTPSSSPSGSDVSENDIDLDKKRTRFDLMGYNMALKNLNQSVNVSMTKQAINSRQARPN